MRKVIVTDLTRFNKQDKVCIATIDLATGECIRPMPYLTSTYCKSLNILPGAILEGDFTISKQLQGPHQEDMEHANLTFKGPSSPEDFLKALDCGLFSSVASGFNIEFKDRQKHIPIGHDLNRSIITIKVNPKTVTIVEDSYKKGKIKLNFCDGSGRWFNYLPITDLGFHNFAMEHHLGNDLDGLNEFVKKQKEVYLRVGLSRSHTSPQGIEGYWIQVNGIYTFPDFSEDIRSYK